MRKDIVYLAKRRNRYFISEQLISRQVLYISIALISLFLINCSSLYGESLNPPRADKGILDLRGWNFKEHGAVQLNGTWEFYRNHHVNPSQLTKGDHVVRKEIIPVPGTWKPMVKDQDQMAIGFATYRLTVLLDKGDNQWALKVTEVGTAYRLYLNGKLVHTMGHAGKTFSDTIPRLYPVYLGAGHVNGSLDILLQVSGFHITHGGIWKAIVFGEKSQIKKIKDKKWIMDLLLIGAILMIMLYYFSVALFRKKETVSLAFGFFCFTILVRSLVTSERLLACLFPEISWLIFLKIEYISLPGMLFAAFAYCRSLFPNEISVFPLNGMKWICLIYGFFVFVTPVRVYAPSLIYFQSVIIFGAFYLLYGLVRAARNRRSGSLLFVFCSVIFFIFSMNDILYSNSIISTGYYLPIGVLIFVVFQSFIMSKRFTEGIYMIEKMTDDLSYANQRLHEEIHEREKTEKEKNALRDQLEASLTKVISGFIPICSSCKKIRDTDENWNVIENYIEERSEVKFSHGLCPECVDSFYPGLMIKLRKKGRI